MDVHFETSLHYVRPHKRMGGGGGQPAPGQAFEGPNVTAELPRGPQI